MTETTNKELLRQFEEARHRKLIEDSRKLKDWTEYMLREGYDGSQIIGILEFGKLALFQLFQERAAEIKALNRANTP